MHTEAQARELWCPMVRMARHEPDDPSLPSGTLGNVRAVGGCNSGGPSARSPSSCRCIASQCAMWRWYDSAARGAFRAAQFGVPPPRRGFCGLAGGPF